MARATIAMLALLAVSCLAASAVAYDGSDNYDLYSKWRPLADASGAWADSVMERKGQVCDPYVRVGEDIHDLPDLGDGCVAIWLAMPGDNFTIGDLPANQQNNFQNTVHYNAAMNFHGEGIMAHSLPRAPQDLNPVCLIANVSGTITLGYEEGNGDRFLPCPGAEDAPNFTEDQILNASPYELEEMCSVCYQAVCTGVGARNPQHCNARGGVQLAQGGTDPADVLSQATPTYHCHLTMANDGACDYVQYDQHEESRDYNMSSAVLCGWEKIRDLNLTFCDCTREANRANNCNRQECLAMALNGVVCGNCGGCNQGIAYESIFAAKAPNRPYFGVCADARNYADAGDTVNARASALMCSQSLFCRGGINNDACRFHCAQFPEDPKCSPETPDTRRRLLSATPMRKMLGVGEEIEILEEVQSRHLLLSDQ